MKGDGWFNRIFLYFTQYEKGHYPEPGGINNQPAKFPELMVTFGSILNVVREEKREQEARQKGKNPPSGGRRPRK